MANLSRGITLKYSIAGGAYSSALPDITGIPALGASPASHQVTDLEDTAHVYIKGLMDIGGTLDFSANFTSALNSAVNLAIAGQTTPTNVAWRVTFPNAMTATFTGEAEHLFPEAVEVDAPITATLSIVPSSAITWA